MQSIDLKTLSKSSVFHFIGADGIGMSSIAEILCKMGFVVQGSNNVDGENIEHLKSLGAKIFIGHNKDNVKNANFVVYSSAIPDDNVEMIYAKENNIPLIERAKMLQFIMDTRKSIGVSGTHGKTTTTSFIGTMLDIAGMKPTIIDGGIMTYYSSSNVLNDGDWVVAETCEAFGNLRHFSVDIAVITNIDPEHMEFYKTFDNLKNYFREYIQRVPDDGLVVLCADHDVVMDLKKEFESSKNIITYGIENDADISAKNIRFDVDGGYFDLVYKSGEIFNNLHIPLFGKHNILNALASIAIAKFLKIDIETIKKALLCFNGAKHRFSKVAKINGISIFDDYAHHPKEIQTTINMAKTFVNDGRIFAIFQPHRFSRLTDLFEDFIKCFDEADFVICMPVFSAGESDIGMKNHIDFFNQLKNHKNDGVFMVSSFDEIPDIIIKNAKQNDIVVSFGAGDIKHLIYTLPNLMDKKNG